MTREGIDLDRNLISRRNNRLHRGKYSYQGVKRMRERLIGIRVAVYKWRCVWAFPQEQQRIFRQYRLRWQWTGQTLGSWGRSGRTLIGRERLIGNACLGLSISKRRSKESLYGEPIHRGKMEKDVGWKETICYCLWRSITLYVLGELFKPDVLFPGQETGEFSVLLSISDQASFDAQSDTNLFMNVIVAVHIWGTTNETLGKDNCSNDPEVWHKVEDAIHEEKDTVQQLQITDFDRKV